MKDAVGDAMNAILFAAEYNLRLIMAWFMSILLLILAAIVPTQGAGAP